MSSSREPWSAQPRGSSRSCTRGGKSRMSNVAAGNRFGGKSVVTTLSGERTHRHRRRGRRPRRGWGVFPRGGEVVRILTCKFTVSPITAVRDFSPECGPWIRLPRSQSDRYQSASLRSISLHSKPRGFATFPYEREGILRRAAQFFLSSIKIIP